jgi:hypothetical protein
MDILPQLYAPVELGSTICYNCAMAYESINGISSEAVEKATGKSWSEWIKIIDKEGGGSMTHKEIARMLTDKKHITRGWWGQMITVGYEYAHGRRVVGETADAGFEIGVQKMIPADKETLWKFLNSPEGKKTWQGDTEVTVRTEKPGERLRMSYNDSVLQITLTCNRNTPEKTNVNFHQEKLKSSKEREHMRKHWKEVLDTIYARYI